MESSSTNQNVYAVASLVDSPAHGAGTTANWSSNEFDCSRDWETCWWGAWCCCLLSNRTAGTFKKGSSFWGGFLFTLAVLVSLFLLAYNTLLSILLILIAVIAYTIHRATTREAIRKELGIPGSIVQDCCNHCCLPCCTVCQEAREAKTRWVLLNERYFKL